MRTYKCYLPAVGLTCCPPNALAALFVQNPRGSLYPCCQWHWDDVQKLKDPHSRGILDQFIVISLQDGEAQYFEQMKKKLFDFKKNFSNHKDEVIIERFCKNCNFPKDLALEMLKSEE